MRKVATFLISMLSATTFAQGVIDVHSHIITPDKISSLVKEEKMIVRLAEIEVYPEYLQEYLSYANEVDRLSVEREPGVICLFPMQSAEDSTRIHILEIYASDAAYQQHLKTEHFQKYKQGTLHMVKSLKLPTMQPLDTKTMKLIFKKQRNDKE